MFFDINLNKLLNNTSSCQRFETPNWSCDAIVMIFCLPVLSFHVRCQFAVRSQIGFDACHHDVWNDKMSRCFILVELQLQTESCHVTNFVVTDVIESFFFFLNWYQDDSRIAVIPDIKLFQNLPKLFRRHDVMPLCWNNLVPTISTPLKKMRKREIPNGINPGHCIESNHYRDKKGIDWNETILKNFSRIYQTSEQKYMYKDQTENAAIHPGGIQEYTICTGGLAFRPSGLANFFCPKYASVIFFKTGQGIFARDTFFPRESRLKKRPLQVAHHKTSAPGGLRATGKLETLQPHHFVWHLKKINLTVW